MSSRLLPIFTFLFFAKTAFAQQVYPVSLTGLLIPPHSLDLSVYGTQRAQDLVFTAALTDPIEPYRDTRLKLYIENNGQTLYTTDPNYGFQPIRLNRNQPVTLDGFALQPYLQPEALLGAAGQGQGSVIVPEGLNRLCLEVIDLERNVPISRKTCVTGGFFLNEPPILQTPYCGSNVPESDFLNQTFTWTPLHNGSGNSPAPVEYLFQLVELQPGVDPNDGFDFSLKILERTTMSPSLIYGPTDPILQPGHIYAWRVQARSMMKPGLIFRNYGYSLVCPFVYGEGYAPFGGPQAAEQMEEDRVPPQGCEVFDTDFGPIFAQDYVPAVVAEGDTVKVGWFDLVVETAVDRGNGYDGRGTIKIPMLNTPIMVDFRRLKVKPNTNRCYEVHSIYGLANMPQFYYEMQDGSYPADYYFSQVKNDFENGPLRNALTDQMDINGAAAILPLGIPSEEGPYMVIVNEIKFTPRNATMTCTAYQVNEDGTLNGFGPTEVPITPYGVKNGARLKVQHGESPYANFAGIFYAGNGGETDKTGMDIDCGGYKSLFLDTEFVIDSTMMKSLDGREARFRLASNKADPNNYFGGIKKLDGFTLPKLPGYQFNLKNGTLDLADGKKLEQNKLERFYAEPTNEWWQGLYLSDVEANLPADLNLLGDGKPVQLDNGDFVLDWSGGHGHFSKTNLLSLSKGRLGTWPYSIDSLQLQIAAGEAQRTWMSGQVKVPVLDEPFNYASELNMSGQTSLNIDLVQGQRTMSLWNGEMAVSADSKLRAVLKDFGPAGKKFMPDADLSGVFSMEIDPKEFDDRLVGNKAIIKQRLKQIFGYTASSPEFKLENLQIGSLQIDPFKLPEERYVLGSYTPDTLGLSIGKVPAKVGQIRLVYKENDGNGREELGFQVVVKKGQNLVQFTFFAKTKANGDGFEFDRIEVETEEVDCNCHAFVPFEEMQPEELDQQLRRTYRKFYAPAVGGNFGENSSGLATANAPDFAEQNSQLLDAYETATLENLRNHLVGGFPLVDEVLNLSFLDLQLDMEGTKAKVAIERSSPDFNFEKIDELPTDGPRQLPLHLTPELLTKMGMTNNQMPKNSRLLITDFEASSTAYTEQNTSVEFTLLVQVSDSSYAQFVRPKVRVSPTSVDMADFYLFLAEDVAVNDPDFNDGEESPAVFFKKSEPKDSIPDPHNDSYAHLLCEGFQKFVIQGEYAVPFSETTVDEEGEETDFPDAQLKYRDNGKDSPSEAESQLQFAFSFVHDFNLDSELELGDFIAAVKSETADGKPLQFVADGQEGVIFHEGTAMEVYFDFDQDFNVDSMPAQAGYDFRGLYFKHITAELEGFVANDTSNIKVDVTDIYFKPDEDFYFNGMGGSFELYDILPFDAGVKMGGWQYSLDTLVIDFMGAAEEDEGMPVQIAGMLRCPVFKYDSEEDLLAYSGQLSFVRETDEETEEVNYHPGAVFTVGEEIEVEEGEEEPENEGSLEGMVFRAEFIPGLTLALDEGSTIGFDWTEMPDGKAGFLPSVDLTGTATLLFSKKATEMAVEAVEIAEELGIDFSLPGATFEGFKINKEPNEEEPGNVTVGNKLGGIQTINMGTWGYSLGFSEEFYEGLGEEKKDSTAAKADDKADDKKPEAKKPAAKKSSNKKSKGIAKGKGKSAGNKPKQPTPSPDKKTEPTANSDKKPAAKKDEAPEKPGMNGFPISIDAPEFEYSEVTKKWAMNLTISINLLPEKADEEDKKEGAKTTTAKKPAKAPKAPAKGKAAKKTEVRTAGIAATTTLSFYAKPDAVRGIVYDGVGLKTIHVMGQFASAEIEGGLHFIKPQTEEDEADWGEGFKAYGSIKMGKTPDGEYRLRGKALFQFGTVARETGTGDFRYFFADLEALYSTNIQPHKGLPLIKAVPPAPPMDIVNLHGGGGGIYYNMEKDPVISDEEEEEEEEEEEPEEEEEEAEEEEEEADEEEAAAKQEEAKADSTINDPKKTQAEKAEAKKKKTAAKAKQTQAKEKKTKAQTKKEKAQKAKEKKLAEAKPGAKKRKNNLKGKKKAATTTKATEATAAASPKKKKAKKVAPPPKEEKADEEEEVDEEAEYEVPEGEWMEPGVSLSGFTYSPKEKSYGGYIKGIFSVVQPKLVSLDVAIGIEVGKNTADKFVFKKIFAKADGYMMSEGIDERTDAPIYATVQAELDFANKLLAGSFNIEADYEIEPILKIKIDGKKTRGSMLVEFKEDGQFYIKAGRPLERMGAEMEAFGSTLGIYAYFQLGQDLDPMPQVADIVPGWPAPAEKIKEREINPSSGIALGMSLHIERNYDFAIFYAKFNGGLGFDVAMGRSDLKCPDGYQVGMDGWMMKGQIFAYAGVDVGLRYKLGALKGKVSILRASIGASLRGQFPNPSVFTGQLAGKYSVLGGLIDGSFNLKFQIASDKDKECLKGLLSKPNPLAEFPLVAETYPNADENEDIPIFAQPKLAYNMSVGYEIKTEDVDDAGNDVVRYFKASLDPSEGFILKKKSNGVKVPCQPIFEAKSTTLKPLQMLEPQTEYTMSWKLKWQEKRNGAWVDIKDDKGKVMAEDSFVVFTTGELPDVIVSEFLDYHAPGRDQRYWHKGYADTRIKFDKAAPPGTDWQRQYFPKNKYVQGFGNVNYDYIVRLTRFANGQEEGVFDVPLSEYPGLKNFQVPVTTYVQVGTMFVIPRVEVQNAQGLNVGFAGLDELITNDPVWKGKLYQIQLMRLPLLPKTEVEEEKTTASSDGANAGSNSPSGAGGGAGGSAGLTMTDADLETTTQTAEASSVSIPKTSLVSNESKLPAEDGLKIIYEYWFATSQYNSLPEKLKDSKLTALQSSAARADFDHPDDETEQNFSYKTQTADFNGLTDDYYAFVPKLEGFDQFDLDRIRLNARLEYPDAYPLKNAIWNPQGGGKYEQFANNLLLKDDLTFWWEATDKWENGGRTAVSRTKLEESYKARLKSSDPGVTPANVVNYWKKRMTDPSQNYDWLGRFLLPDSDKDLGLTPEEIENQALTTYQTYNGQKVRSGFKGNLFQTAQPFALAVQDLRYRILGLQYLTMRTSVDGYFKNLGESINLGTIGQYEDRFRDKWADFFWFGQYPDGLTPVLRHMGTATGNLATMDLRGFKNWYLNLLKAHSDSKSGGNDIADLTTVSVKNYLDAGFYTGKVEITMPELGKWQDMGQSVQSSWNAYPKQKFTVYPNRPGVSQQAVAPAAIAATSTGADAFVFSLRPDVADIYLESYPRDADISSIEIQVNGKKVAFWDAKAREVDLYNYKSGKRAIKYDVAMNGGEASIPGAGTYGGVNVDGRINLSKLFRIEIGDGNSNAAWTLDSLYKHYTNGEISVKILVNTNQQTYTYEGTRFYPDPPSYHTRTEKLANKQVGHNSQRQKALHFSRGAGANANMLTMKMIGAQGGWDFGACLVVDKETNQAVAHLAADRKLTRYSYNAEGFLADTSTYTDGGPMVELDPTRNYALYVAKSGQTQYGASLLLDKEAFWQDKVGQFFEENTFSSAANLGTIEAPKPVGFSKDPAKDGQPIAVPGRWQAVDFAKPNMPALVGQGMTYYDLDKQNNYGHSSYEINLYRPNEYVESFKSGEIVDIKNGEWLAYIIDVPTEGQYLLKLTAAARGNKRYLNLELDGNRLNMEPLVMDLTNTYKEKRFEQPFQLSAGEHLLKLGFADDGFFLSHLELISFQPDIEVSGKNLLIADGTTIAKTEDGTDFGLRPCPDGEPVVFTLKNKGVGKLKLTGNPLVSLSGPNADDFKVLKMPTVLELNEGDSTQFNIQFYPTESNTGSRTATVTVRSNDADGQEGEFTFPIRATNSPVMAEIKSGDRVLESRTALPGTDDPRHFGKVYGSAPVTRQFVLNNRGNAPLTLSHTVTLNNVAFTVSDFPTVVPANGSKAFNVTFTPQNNLMGEVQAQLNITSTGCEQNPIILPLVAVLPGVALDFDGQNDCVEIPVPDLGSGNAITIEYWFKGTSAQSAVRLQDGQAFIVAGYQGKHIISTDGSVNGISMGNATDGKWHHVAMTWERNRPNGFRSYLDGNLVQQRNSADVALPTITQGAFLGAYGGSSEFMRGSLDEVRIWNRSLSQYEIQQRMNCELQGDEPGLQAYFDFNQGIAGAENPDELFVKNKAAGTQASLRNFALQGNTSNWVRSNSPLAQNQVCSVALPFLALTDRNGDEYPSGSALDFDEVKSGESKLLTLTISNPGTGALNFTASPKITLSGADAGQFSISSDLSSASVPAGGEAKFTVRFTPTGQGGSKVATLTIPNNSGGGSDFVLQLKGSSSAAIMALTGNGAAIADGSTSTSAATHTDFGGIGVGGIAERIFTIKNTGTGLLNLGGISLGGDAKDDFKIIAPAKTSLKADSSTTFTLQFLPTQMGQRSAVVTLASNLTGDAAQWTFAVTGNGVEGANVLAFDGKDDYIEMPKTTYFEGDFSAEAWVFASPNTNTSFFSKLLDFSDETGYNRVTISLQHQLKLEIVRDGVASSLVSSTYLPTNRWAHVAVALMGNQASIYINGSQVATGQVQSPKSVAMSNNQIGRAQGVGPLYLDEFRLWNRWLSEEDVTARMGCELNGQETNLIIYFDFNQGTAAGSNALVNLIKNKIQYKTQQGSLKNFALTGGVSNWVSAPDKRWTQNCFYEPRAFAVSKPGSNKLKTGQTFNDFGQVAKGQEEPQLVEIQNLEEYPKTVRLSIIGADSSNFSVVPAMLSIPARGKKTATVYFKPKQPSTTALVAELKASSGQSSLWTGTLIGYAVEAGATALFFGGDDDKVTVPAGNYFTSDFTIEAWVNRIYTPAGATLLNFSDGAGNRIELAYPSLKITRNGVAQSIAVGQLPSYEWKHVAVSLRGKNGFIYVDGVLAQSFVLDAPLNSTGWTNCTLGAGSMMKLDEFRIWNRSLNVQEIKARMNCELAGSEDGLTLYYRFNQGVPNGINTGKTALRSSSQGSTANGQLVGFGLNYYVEGQPLNNGKSNWVAGESPVDGACAAFVALPEIALQGGKPLAAIAKGSTQPAVENATDFGNQGISTEIERIFELTNTGAAPLNISSITAGNGFTVENLEKTTLAPYEKTTFSLIFKPTSLQKTTATVTVNSNLPEPWKFDVAGTGMEAASNLHFDGVNDEISVNLSGVEFANWQTIEFWAKVADKQARPVLWKDFNVILENGALKYNGTTLTSGLAANNWYHFALVRNTATSKVTCFLNGKKVSEKAVSASLNDSYKPETLEIGQYMSGTHFKGNLDELRIWSSSLTAADVLQRMYCELKSSEPGLLLYYRFNQGKPGSNENYQANYLASANAAKPNGELKNFGLYDAESNWVSGSPVTIGAKCEGMSSVAEIDVLRGINALENNASVGSDTDFGSVSPGDSKSMNFTLANKGGAALTFSGSPIIAVGGVHAGQFSISPEFTMGTLGAFEETDFAVKFTPDGSCETCAATLTIASNDSDEGNFVINLQARAQSGSQIVLQDVSGKNVPNEASGAEMADLGTVNFGDFKDYTFTIANTGNEELTIGEIKIVPPYLGYSILSKPDKVPSKGAASLVFRFQPQFNPYNPLTAHSLALEIPSNDPDESSFLFNLKGTATAGGAELDVMPEDWSHSPAYKDLMASGSTFDFGKSNVGSQVVKKFFMLNSGSGGNISLSGMPAVQLTGSPNFTVSAQPELTSIPAATTGNSNGNRTTFTVTFTPSGEVGERTAQLSIQNSDSDEGNFVVNIKGQVLEEGGEFDMMLTTEDKAWVTSEGKRGLENKWGLSESIAANRTLDFGEGKIGIETTKIFKISNTGSKLLKFTGTPKFALTGPDADQFSLENMATTTSLAPQAFEWLNVIFKPSGMAGEKNATLTILNNDGDEGDFVLQLKGKKLDSTTEIDVKKYGTNTSIASNAPAGPDTDFGEVVTGNFGYLGFLITNEPGRDPIIFTGNPKVVVSGANADQVSASISKYNDQTYLNVNFNPSGTDGERNATLTIPNNDPDEGNYIIHVKGRAKYAAPEIELNSGWANSWTHDPLESNSTIDFGGMFGGNTKIRNFNVLNTGEGGLVLSGQKIAISGENADQFEVTSGGNNYNYIMENPNGNYIVQKGSVGKFTIRFKPTGTSGERKAVVTITSNDPDEGSFIINLKGRVN